MKKRISVLMLCIVLILGMQTAFASAASLGDCCCSSSVEGVYMTAGAKDHEWNQGIVTRRATCCSAGEIVYTCDNCGQKIKEILPRTGHGMVVDKKAVTATFSRDGHTFGCHCPYCQQIMEMSETVYRLKSASLEYSSCTYGGSAKTPDVKVKDRKGHTISGINYSIKYGNNVKAGKAYAKISFKGAYSGTKTIYFKINPMGTSIVRLTPVKTGFKVSYKKQGTQASGYQIRYSKYGSMNSSKTVTVAGTKNVSKSIKGLAAHKKYYVQVRTYKTVDGTKYYSGWSVKKVVTTK